jgi:hypothetical protein
MVSDFVGEDRNRASKQPTKADVVFNNDRCVSFASVLGRTRFSAYPPPPCDDGQVMQYGIVVIINYLFIIMLTVSCIKVCVIGQNTVKYS